MKAKHLFNSAMLNLGYRQKEDTYEPGITFINQVCADISTALGSDYNPVKSLTDDLNLSDKVINSVAVYGVAMHLALYRGDGDKNQFYAALYNQRRRLLSSSSQRLDTLPKGED